MKMEKYLTETMRPDDIVSDIARDILGIPTLRSKNSDDLDFHDIHVTLLKKALLKAFEEGSGKERWKHVK